MTTENLGTTSQGGSSEGSSAGVSSGSAATTTSNNTGSGKTGLAGLRDKVATQQSQPGSETSSSTTSDNQQGNGLVTQEQAVAAAKAQAQYQVNRKYKVMKEEKEIPEWLAGAITNAEQEKFVREALEWAGGTPHIKEHAQRVEQQLQQIVQEYSPQVQTLQMANQFLESRDFDSFFKLAGIQENEILKYAEEILDRRELPPAQRQAVQELPNLRQENMTLQQKYDQLQQQFEYMTVQQRTNELNTHLSRPEISATVASFDARLGKAGAFRAEVIRRGQYYHDVLGQDKPVEEVVNEVLMLVGQSAGTPPAMPPQPPQMASAMGQGMGTPGQTTVAPGVGAKPPVLPNISGRGTSPVKKTFKSTDDIRKYAASRRS